MSFSASLWIGCLFLWVIFALYVIPTRNEKFLGIVLLGNYPKPRSIEPFLYVLALVLSRLYSWIRFLSFLVFLRHFIIVKIAEEDFVEQHSVIGIIIRMILLNEVPTCGVVFHHYQFSNNKSSKSLLCRSLWIFCLYIHPPWQNQFLAIVLFVIGT